MLDDIAIRQADERDVTLILSLMNEAILHTTSSYYYEPKDAAYVNEWMKNKAKAEMPVIVYDDGNSSIGYATYDYFRPKEGYRFTVENSIYLKAEYRHKGIGKLLMENLLGIAKRQGVHSMIAGIDAENITSIQFHEKLGFIKVGHFREVGFKFERWLDLVFMQKLLV